MSSRSVQINCWSSKPGAGSRSSFYKELKLEVNQGALLAGQRTETAAQQVAAMMIACSLLAEERLAIAGLSPDKDVRQAGAVRISFAMCQEYTAALFLVLQSSEGLMDKHAQCPGRTGQTRAC